MVLGYPATLKILSCVSTGSKEENKIFKILQMAEGNRNCLVKIPIWTWTTLMVLSFNQKYSLSF